MNAHWIRRAKGCENADITSTSPCEGSASSVEAAISRQTGSNCLTRCAVKYVSTIRRYRVCSGGSMELGTERWRETVSLKVP